MVMLQAPTPRYLLDGWVGNDTDAAGVDWIVETEEGWSGSPGVRLSMEDQPDADGAYDGPSYRGPRTITLSGRAVAPSRALMLAAKDTISGLLSDQGEDDLQVLQVQEAHMTRRALVRLAADTKVADIGARMFTWSLALVAPDPRRYLEAEQVLQVGLPAGGAGRVYPRSYPFGYPPLAATQGGEVLPNNAGTARSYPVLVITGPVDNPRIENVTEGRVLELGLSLSGLDSLEIDLQARTVVLNESVSRRDALSRSSEWWSLARGVNRVTYRAAAYSAGTRMTLRYRSAWW